MENIIKTSYGIVIDFMNIYIYKYEDVEISGKKYFFKTLLFTNSEQKINVRMKSIIGRRSKMVFDTYDECIEYLNKNRNKIYHDLYSPVIQQEFIIMDYRNRIKKIKEDMKINGKTKFKESVKLLNEFLDGEKNG